MLLQLVAIVTVVWGALHLQTGVLGFVRHGYRLAAMNELSDGNGIVAHLELIQESQLYGPDIRQLNLTARYQSGGRIQVHLTDGSRSRYEVPELLVPRKGVNGLEIATAAPTDAVGQPWNETNGVVRREGALSATHPLELSYTVEPFGFAIVRRSNGEVLFNSTPCMHTTPGLFLRKDGSIEPSFGSMVYKEQYLEISTQLPLKSSLYGLGEITKPSGLRLKPGNTYTLFATDIGSWNIEIDLYSSFPFYMEMRDKGNAHGVLLLNSNGMDVTYEDDSLKYQVIGGVFDFYFFAGPSPLAVVDQLTELVGRPVSMPSWAFGFHQAKYGYQDVAELETVVANYKKASLPLESIWADIDYMDNYKDFTLHPVNYPREKLLPFVERLHADDQKFMIIVDPGIKIDEGYSTYHRGAEMDIYMRNGTDPSRRPYIAQVWPRACNMPDYLHPNAQSWWSHEVTEFHKVVPFDGLWLDMNEPANFCTGPNCYRSPDVNCPINMCCMICNNTNLSQWDDPPYRINVRGDHSPLYYKTVAMTAEHYGGVRSYDAHNIYGMSQSLATYRALLETTNRRPFVLSRSSFIGSGSHSAHWTGDNAAFWGDLKYSITMILESGIFGIPMVGADICGFYFDTNEELCRRWTQVGAFYPFSRDHSDAGVISQELYVWESVKETAKQVFWWRYRLFPFFYTLMYEAHRTGAPIARPLFFEFPEDKRTWPIGEQFLLGKAILVSPVLEPEEDSVRAYFPKGIWYNLFDHGSKLVRAVSRGCYQELPAPPDTINVHLRQGSIVPMQDFAMTISEVRKTPFTLIIVFAPASDLADYCTSGTIACKSKNVEYASGQLFVDNDEEIQMEIKAGKSTFVKYEAFRTEGKYALRASVTEGDYALQQGLMLKTVSVLGVESQPDRVLVDGVPLASVKLKLNVTSSTLDFSQLNLPVGKNFLLEWETPKVRRLSWRDRWYALVSES